MTLPPFADTNNPQRRVFALRIFQMLSGLCNWKAILAIQGYSLKGAIITSNKKQQLCIISCLATVVETKNTLTREVEGNVFFCSSGAVFDFVSLSTLCQRGCTQIAI